jgi:hypothetical protein
MKAATRIVKIDRSRSRLELRAGAKGTGRVLWACNFWPDSSRSIDEMDRLLYNYCAAQDIQLAYPRGMAIPEK